MIDDRHFCMIPPGNQITPSVKVGPRVVLAGEGIVVRDNAIIDAAAVVGEGVTIGQGAWVHLGAVVLKSVPANAILKSNPARVVGYRDRAGALNRPAHTHIDVESLGHLPRPRRWILAWGRAHCS